MDLTPLPLTNLCRSVALLIDGDNLPSAVAASAFAAARRLGALSAQRVYGDARRLGGWHEVPGLRVLHAHSGKNVTDMLLTIDALDLSYSGRIDGFALATSDRDFAPLAQALRSRGFPVLGLLGEQAPAMFAQSCSATITLALPPAPAMPAAPKPAAKPPDPREACARALLSRAPCHPQTFATAMKSAGYALPAASADWRSWAKSVFPGLVVTGSGENRRMVLPAD